MPHIWHAWHGMGMPGGRAWAPPPQQQPDFGLLGGASFDVSELENLGQPKPKPQDDIDWGILERWTGRASSQPAGPSDEGDPFMMGAGRDGRHRAASTTRTTSSRSSRASTRTTSRPTSRPPPAAAAAGTTDARALVGCGAQGVGEAHEGQSVGGNSSSRSSFGWDAGSATFTSPASLLRIRSQAEKIFDDNISLVHLPRRMHRTKAQTDSMVRGERDSISTVTSVFTDVRSTLFSWFR